MADGLPTIWAAEAHTLAKHEILKSYLGAWAPILSNAKYVPGDELLFVDAFAGPGGYSTGELGSPLVALNAVLNHHLSFPRPVRFRFIEKDPARFALLRERLAEEEARISSSAHVRLDEPICGSCESEIRNLMAERRAARKPLGPALFFLDQFGYSQVSMKLLAEILCHDYCEVFIYVNCQRQVPYLTDETKSESLNATYGSEVWRAAIPLEGRAKQDFLISAYKDALKTSGATSRPVYPWSFTMFSSQGQLLHWLVFATRSLSGLENMKKAMWRADGNGGYRFSDRDDPNQQTFFTDMDTDAWHADELSRRLSGRTMSESEMNLFVLTQTPFYKFKRAVKVLRKQGRAFAVNKASDWPVRFA